MTPLMAQLIIPLKAILTLGALTLLILLVFNLQKKKNTQQSNEHK